MFAVIVTKLSYGSVNDKQTAQPELYIVTRTPNEVFIRAEDVNLPKTTEWKIVIATHGWIELKQWTKGFANDTSNKVDANEWVCGWFDWRKESRVLNPRDAAKFARDTGGPLLAEKILKISRNPKHIHLIGHSSGCWAISEAAKIIAQKTNASIHLTFLDAYVPLGWDADLLGNIPVEPNKIYWADHYMTRDITGKVTFCNLIHCHNVDISNATPGFNDHRFPFHWYPATVSGRFDPNDKYADKILYDICDNIKYGFARSLEAGTINWKESLTLPKGKKAVKIKKF